MMQGPESHIQAVTLFVLAITAGVAVWQLLAATKQAKSSVEQAKASVRMAQFSLEQTELMRMQVHASFRPIVTVTGGAYGPNIATLTLKNVGTGPAITIFGVYRSGVRQSVGSLSVEQTTSFHFDNYNNVGPERLGPLEPGYQSVSEGNQTVPLRLEYLSASGAHCWTEVKFRLGGEGPVEPEIKYGMDIPSLTTNL
jgi:hypothetical protein